jgi:UDP-N-acetylmuramoyl-L-alanyl-D-glutamate--2,6-diaminopimelate ligase
MDAITGLTGLASDSREVRKGYLFAALSGARADGAAFIGEAVRRGAVAILGEPRLRERAESLGVRFIADANPRARLAQLAAAFFGAQPATVSAVTGTNGKTSVAVFLRQIWEREGLGAASMGTVGVVRAGSVRPLVHTTPDPIETHRVLAELAQAGVDHLALEASSIGLDQYRLDGVEIAAAGFTNLTRDHLDYHADFDAYRTAKLRLFTDLVRPGGAGVINADAEDAPDFIRAVRARGLQLLTVGQRGETLRLEQLVPHSAGQTLTVSHQGRAYEIALPLAGAFQASNALVAAALAMATGTRGDAALAALAHLSGAPGRLELVAYAPTGAPVYVDYAHTPDALVTVLQALRPHVAGRLVVVFGCGGDRDRGKRPLMGAAAHTFADSVIVTDDNPRSEEAGAIRREILSGCPSAREIGDREAAIHAGIAELAAGDCLVIAGKGHETGQIVGATVHPFSDRDVAVAAARGRDRLS